MIGATIDIVRPVKIPAYIVFNGTPARGNLTNEARQALEAYNVRCAPCLIGQRVVFVYALTDGLTMQESELGIYHVIIRNAILYI